MAHSHKPVTLEEKKNVLAVKEYFKNEKMVLSEAVKQGKIERSNLPIQYNQVRKRTADALSLSEETVKRVTSQFKKEGSVLPPNQQARGRKKKELDSFSEGVVRRAVMMMYSKKQFPTVKSLHAYLQEDENFPRMSAKTLWARMKKQLGFKFGKFHGKPIVMERDDIAAQRHHYLRTIRRYRSQSYEIFYTDESWCSQNHSLGNGWHIPENEVLGMFNARPHIDVWLKGVGKRFSDGMIGGISSRPSGAGQRIILLNIGSENGFLEGLGRTFIGKKDSSDYHQEMNSQHFEEWFSCVLEKLPSKSVIVVDRASYHRRVTQLTKNPTTSWKKADVIDWMQRNRVPLPNSYDSFQQMTLPVLRVLAKQNQVENKFVIEEMAENCGKDIKILWLPVAHCELNAIELIWAFVKNQVAKSNGTFKIKDVLHLCEKTLSEVTSELWKNCIDHVKKLEDLLVEKEHVQDEFHQLNPIIIPLDDSSTDYETESSQSDSENSE